MYNLVSGLTTKLIVVVVWISYNEKRLEAKLLDLLDGSLILPCISSFSLSYLPWCSLLSFDISFLICLTPFSSSSLLFIGFLSGLAMIMFNGFFVQVGPLEIIPSKKGVLLWE